MPSYLILVLTFLAGLYLFLDAMVAAKIGNRSHGIYTQCIYGHSMLYGLVLLFTVYAAVAVRYGLFIPNWGTFIASNQQSYELRLFMVIGPILYSLRTTQFRLIHWVEVHKFETFCLLPTWLKRGTEGRRSLKH
jgi:hypothetical protein